MTQPQDDAGTDAGTRFGHDQTRTGRANVRPGERIVHEQRLHGDAHAHAEQGRNDGESALLAIGGGSGTHNNATLWVVTDDQIGSYVTTTTTKLLDTTDDYVANDPPRAVSSWTPQRRTIETQGSHTLTRHYYATVIFDKFGTDPQCDTGHIDQSQ